jgi:hypothetical protein
LEATSSKSQAQFLDKLREKKQTDWQIKHAAHAVSLYWDVQSALKPSAAASGAEPLSWDRALSELVAVIKTRHYSPKTLKSYSHWAQKLHDFRKARQPSSLSSEDVKEFLTYLAVKCGVSASSQNQAFNALLFFFRHVLQKDFGEIRDMVRAKRRPYIPVVLSRQEVDAVIRNLYPPYDLVAKMLYG